MATSYTPNFNLAKPLVNGPETENTWGFDINANFDKLDAAIADQISITEVREVVEDIAANLIKAGNNVAVVYDDVAGRFTIHGLPISGTPGPQNVFDTIHDARLALVPAAVKNIMLMGYNRAGDAGPAMQCRRTAAMVTIHKGVFRTTDRYTDAGVEDITNGGWWEYVGGHHGIAVEWFGAIGDYLITPPGRDGNSYKNPTPTDSTQAFMDASNFAVYSIRGVIHPGTHYGWSSGPTLLLGCGSYYITSTIEFGISVILRGASTGIYHDFASTRIYVPAGVTPFRFLSTLSPYNDQAGSAGSELHGIYIQSEGKVPAAPGIIAKGTIAMERCSVTGFGGHGVDASADVEEDTPEHPEWGTASNLFYFARCSMYNNGGDGIRAAFGDANAGTVFACNLSANGGYGFNDLSFLGNFIIANHFNGNGLGAWYMAGINNRGGAFANYVENIGPPVYVGANCVSMGGYVATGYAPTSEGFVYADGGISQHRVDYRGPSHASNKLQLNIKEQPNTILGMRVDGNVFPHQLTYEHGSGIFAWRWGDTSDVPLWCYSITTEQRVRTYGRTEGVRAANIAFHKGIFLGGDPPGIDAPRYFGTVDHYIAQFIYGAGFTMPPGPYAIGDTLISGGGGIGGHWGEYCMTAGAHCPLAWASGSNYSAPDFYQRGGSYVKNSAGRIYRCTVDPGGTILSTDEPTHPSGDQAYPDGYTWRWLADGEAVFKRFGALMGAPVVTAASDPIFHLTQTWNNAAVQFVGHRTVITDTASHTDSFVQDWVVGGVQKAAVRKDGVILSNGVPVVMATELDELYATIAVLNDRLAALEAR